MNHLFELPEKICYVQCGICTTILLVSVPCSSLSMEVTVTCGHCSSLLSVNMMRATLVPLHFLSSLSRNLPKEGCREMSSGKLFDSFIRSNLKFSEYEVEEGLIPVTPPSVNKPPEKRQRVPSAYNCFIKDEIRRLKAENPQMTHKEAFRTAAKNWANFPPTIQQKEDPQNTQIPEFQVEKNGKCFPRHSVLT
ncbi:axial regulator YABBY 4 isoform X1 [Cucurbita pepo subsp. pepo]|uniref:axial regulator YABBY 4 isoform X1 n=1 Tax=Cucurbita pepo subsp. pepo TaxID=3664 RepID=UPI000C9D55A3|nr:axial regulator YABBY 4 isoform X1 [Cucurbita pepo subsp. pepo]